MKYGIALARQHSNQNIQSIEEYLKQCSDFTENGIGDGESGHR
jgi:hypothetical protein